VFTKQGGSIYGQDESTPELRNTAQDFRSGHAVYVSESDHRNSTAGNGVTLDSSVSGAAGGWVDTVPENLPLEETLKWFDYNRVTKSEYTFTLNKNETIAPSSLSTSNSVSITIKGDGTERKIILSEKGSLFTVDSGVTLILDSNITLQGLPDNNEPLVRVWNGGALEMNADSKITGNTTSYSGGGVDVSSGTFTMRGGTISGNTTSDPNNFGGGGVYVSGGVFTMSGGIISCNTTSNYGGGVYVDGSTLFTMSGGTISKNTANCGGGVYVNGGAFTKQTGGTIYGSGAGDLSNTATSGNGHAAYVNSSPAKMRNNTADALITLDSSTSSGWVYE
jgi:hypothetical protein